MKYGIYYAYWQTEWAADYKYYIEKVAKLGFDILEISAVPLMEYSDEQLKELKDCADANGISLTVGYGPSAENNISSADPKVSNHAKEFYKELFRRMKKIDAHVVCGALYSYWPVDYTKPIDKKGDWDRSVKNLREIADTAAECGVNICLEVLNRFEGYILNTAKEAVEFVKQVGKPNVKVHLDTFHMNIEEDSLAEAIRTAGPYLGHIHTGECNRKVPGKGRTPWREIKEALRDINYDGAIVMEPFVMMGGQVGADIKIWRDLSNGADEKQLDNDAREAVNFSRYMLEYK
jgi:D-psicose/D-tagatose/L-ribulose 3-epimerase